jgi:hypothetical protein
MIFERHAWSQSSSELGRAGGQARASSYKKTKTGALSAAEVDEPGACRDGEPGYIWGSSRVSPLAVT